MGREWPLVGRGPELASAARALTDPSTRGLVLAGDAGVGKTRLAAEVLHLADASGYATARVLATRSAGRLPLGALSPLLPAVTEPWDQPVDALRWARAALVARGGERRLALLVDDAHLLDDVSAALVWQLADSGDAFVIATIRAGEPAPDPVVALWKEGVGDRLDVGPIDLAAIDELLTAVLGGAVAPATARLLAERSGGNPLYLRELVTAAVDHGVLRQERGVWRVAQGSVVLSVRLVELVSARIGVLGDPERHALELVSYGEPLAVTVLPPDQLSAIEALGRRGLVTVARDGRRLVATVAHPLYGEVVLSQTSVLRERAVYRELAGLIEQTGGRRREDPLRFAQWRMYGGGSASPDLMLRAAYTARSYGDLEPASRLAEAAAAAGAGFEAELLVAQLAVLQGRADEAERQFCALAGRVQTDTERAMLAESRIDNLLVGLARPYDALCVADQAEASLSDRRLVAEMGAIRAQLLYHLGRSGPALVAMERVIDQLEGRALVRFAPTAALCLTDAGRLARAAEVARRGHETHQALGGRAITFGPHMHLVPLGVALAHEGRLLEAQSLAENGYRDAVENGVVEAHANFAQLLGWILIVRGCATAGARSMAESLTLYRERGWKTYVMFALANLAHAEALRGDPESAVRALTELADLGIPEAHDLGNPLVVQARAWVSAASGDLPTARRHLLEGAEHVRGLEIRTLEAALLHDHARLGGPVEVARRLAELADVVEGDLVKARAEYASALHAGDAGRLEAVSDAFDGMGAWLYAAEAAAGAAVALRRAGEKRRAAQLERSMAVLARRCEGAVTPALRAIETQAILSARELEVASLAATGLSNRAIAERLFVSVRTVETQLQHVYEKLGVSRRGELSRALDAS